MDQFRLILVLVGIVILLLVYFLSRRSGSRWRETREALPEIPRDDLSETPGERKRESPTRYRIPMSGDVAPPERPYQAALEPPHNQPRKSRKRYVKFLSGSDDNRSKTADYYPLDKSLEPLTVMVYVMPLPGITFRREQVARCLESLGCVPRSDAGYDYVILDRERNKSLQRLFMITDAHEPGIFARDEQVADKTNGLIFEMRLPGPMDSVMAFEKLLDIARLVATKLNGVVCDDLQNRLTKQTTMHIKDKILDHNRKMRFTQSSSMQ